MRAQHLLQAAVEWELTPCWGWAHSQRGTWTQPGWRTEDAPQPVRTPRRGLHLARPQAATREPFRSPLLARVAVRTQGLEGLVAGRSLRGLSTLDGDALWTEIVGERVLRRSGVSQGPARLTAEFELWRQRHLSRLQLVFLFLDAISLPVRPPGERRESFDAWLAFRPERMARGLGDSLLIIPDGDPGLCEAGRAVFPQALSRRCPVLRMRDILAKLPRAARPSPEQLRSRVFWAESPETGGQRRPPLLARCRARFPSAVACLTEDLGAWLAFLQVPRTPPRVLRATTLVERIFGEECRRPTGTPRVPTETACPTRVFPPLRMASRRRWGVPMTAANIWDRYGLRDTIFPRTAAAA